MGQYVTTITLDHTLYTGTANRPQKPSIESSTTPSEWLSTEKTRPPPWLNPRPTKPPVQPPPPIQIPQPIQNLSPVPEKPNQNSDRFGESDFECGNPEYQPPVSTGLIFGGRVANRGQFPW